MTDATARLSAALAERYEIRRLLPHILALRDSGDAAGFLYYVMPCIDGASHRQRLEGGRCLGTADALAIAARVKDALSYAHRMGILHRDIKPEHPVLAGASDRPGFRDRQAVRRRPGGEGDGWGQSLISARRDQ